MDDNEKQSGPSGCWGTAVKILAYGLLAVAILFGLIFGWCALGSHR